MHFERYHGLQHLKLQTIFGAKSSNCWHWSDQLAIFRDCDYDCGCFRCWNLHFLATYSLAGFGRNLWLPGRRGWCVWRICPRFANCLASDLWCFAETKHLRSSTSASCCWHWRYWLHCWSAFAREYCYLLDVNCDGANGETWKVWWTILRVCAVVQKLRMNSLRQYQHL